MPSYSASKQKIRQDKNNHHSFNILCQSTTGEIQQIIQYEPESIKDGKILFSLPYNVQISDIVSHLTIRFSQQTIFVQQDDQGGKILLKGIRNSKKKLFFINLLDCMGLLCFRYGLNGGSLHETYNIITISIKKEILNNRCLISIQNQQHNQQDRCAYMTDIVSKTQQQLKMIDVSHDSVIRSPMVTRYLSPNSLFFQQVQIKERIFNIFIYVKDKKWQRFRRLFRKSQDTIKQKIDHFYLTYQNKQQTSGSKKNTGLTNPFSLIQAVIFESQSLYRTLVNYYQKQLQEQSQLGLFVSLLDSPAQRQTTLYSIQQIISTQYLDQIFLCYLQSTQQQCNLFNRNAKQLNEKLDNTKFFDYLQLKDKFRLTELNHPYAPSIQILRQIPNCSCPRQLLLNIQKVFGSVKVDCLKASKGRVQLSTMDDLLPVMIFVTAKASVQNFPAYVKMIDDYVRLKNVFELQERIITTLYVAVEDITKRWNP